VRLEKRNGIGWRLEWIREVVREARGVASGL